MHALRLRSAFAALFIALAASSSPAAAAPPVAAARRDPVERVEVEDVIQGCFGGSNFSHVLVRRGSQLVSARRRVAADAVEQLAEVLLASRDAQQEPLAALGITTDTLHAHRADIAASIRQGQSPAVGADTRALEANLTDEKVAAALRAQLRWPESTLSIRFTVKLHRGTQVLVAESQAHKPWMLPWKITSAGKSWLTYSPEVARALAELVAEDAPQKHLLRTGQEYWRDGVWRDRDTWSSLGMDVQLTAGERMYRELPGWEEARGAWKVDTAMVGDINGEETSLFLELSRLTPATEAEPIDSVRWYSPLRNGRPSSDWRDLARALTRANAALRKHRWIRQWAAAGPGREVELQVVGDRGYSGAEDLPFFVLPVWRHAGLRGEPEFEVLLRRDRGGNTTLYFGSQDDRATITATDPEGVTSKHWLDREEEVFFHPKGERDYVLVRADGSHERRTAE